MNSAGSPLARALRLVVVGAMLATHAGPASAQTRSIRFSVADIVAPQFRASGIAIALEGRELSQLRLRVAAISAFGQTWKDLQIECLRFRIERSVLACDHGALKTADALPLRFRYDAAASELQVSLLPGAAESWTMSVHWSGGGRRLTLDLAGASLARLRGFLPAWLPAVAAGSANGRITATIPAVGAVAVKADVAIRDVAFSDADGLKAGENVGGRLALEAGGQGTSWQWKAQIDWDRGEVFWQPFYSRAGHSLAVSGIFDAHRIEINQGALRVNGVGTTEFRLAYDRDAGRVARLDLQTGGIDLAPLYDLFLKPALANTPAADLRVQGQVRLQAAVRDGRIEKGRLDANDVFIEDKNRRFALFGLTASVPWSAVGETEAHIVAAGAELQKFPLGAIDARLRLHNERISADEIRIPILSGALTLNNLRIFRQDGGWQWEFRGGLTPVPLPALMAQFGLPAMQGNISGVIPRVHYGRSTLTVDGALLIRVFDGSVVVKNLVATDPLGVAPRLAAEVDARELDLGLITRTFSFGSITGKVDVAVKNLQLSNWRPEQFDAVIESSPGRHRKRISQTAVNNISSLGGAGATVALQRTFLRFFEEFSYAKLGLSCRLRQGVCGMSGIEDTPQGYTIVKGGGIPAITVMGYNREVGWNELLTRLNRITKANLTPVIK